MTARPPRCSPTAPARWSFRRPRRTAASARSCSAPTAPARTTSSSRAPRALIRMRGHETFREAVARLVARHRAGRARRRHPARGHRPVRLPPGQRADPERGRRAARACPVDRVVDCIAEYGNTSAATLPLALALRAARGPAADRATACCSARSAPASRGARQSSSGVRHERHARPDHRRRRGHAARQRRRMSCTRAGWPAGPASRTALGACTDVRPDRVHDHQGGASQRSVRAARDRRRPAGRRGRRMGRDEAPVRSGRRRLRDRLGHRRHGHVRDAVRGRCASAGPSAVSPLAIPLIMGNAAAGLRRDAPRAARAGVRRDVGLRLRHARDRRGGADDQIWRGTGGHRGRRRGDAHSAREGRLRRDGGHLADRHLAAVRRPARRLRDGRGRRRARARVRGARRRARRARARRGARLRRDGRRPSPDRARADRRVRPRPRSRAR